MTIITEATLRAALLQEGIREYRAPAEAFVTPLAREYLSDRKIELVFSPAEPCETMQVNPEGMPCDPVQKNGEKTYRDAATGANYAEKPENMTHLRGNLLVSKSHPRIALRGKLDTLEAEIVCLQVRAQRQGYSVLTEQLEDALHYTRAVLSAEVRELALGEPEFCGLSPVQLREISHNVKKEIGIAHPVPNRSYGEIGAGLNLLRVRARECELAAVTAFAEDGAQRMDIIQALNRLSSGFYILLCRFLAEQVKEGRR